MQKLIPIATLTLVLAALLIKLPTRTIVDAASHREAPLISQDPLADNTDVYAFVSPDRPDTVTILANYIPFEEPSGGPGYFRFDPHVLYEIKIDNTGDGEEDVAYQFRFKNTIANPDTFLIHRGPGVLGVDSDAQISSLNDPDYNLKQTYSVVRKVRKSGTTFESTVLGTNLISPPPHIGTGATPNYADLALAAINTIGDGIKVFAGQRDEAFYIDLGAIFDRFELRTLDVPAGLGQPADAFGSILPDPGAVRDHRAQVELPLVVAGGRRSPEPPRGLAVVLLHALARVEEHPQVELSQRVTLAGGLSVPRGRRRLILSHSLARVVEHAQEKLGVRIVLRPVDLLRAFRALLTTTRPMHQQVAGADRSVCRTAIIRCLRISAKRPRV